MGQIGSKAGDDMPKHHKCYNYWRIVVSTATAQHHGIPINIQLYGSKGKTGTLPMHEPRVVEGTLAQFFSASNYVYQFAKNKDLFQSEQVDEFIVFAGVDIGSLQKIRFILSNKKDVRFFQGWRLRSITIENNLNGDQYEFVPNEAWKERDIRKPSLEVTMKRLNNPYLEKQLQPTQQMVLGPLLCLSDSIVAQEGIRWELSASCVFRGGYNETYNLQHSFPGHVCITL